MPTKLNTATNRARLPRSERHVDPIAPGVALVYRRGPKANKDGTWSVRVRSMPGGASPYALLPLGLADDITEADGVRWLTYRQAAESALAKAKEVDRKTKASPLTVGEACASYIERRKARGTGRPADDETAFKTNLGTLADRRVAGLTHDILQAWAHRARRHVARPLRAALNQTPVAIRPSSVTLSALKEHLPMQPAGLIETVMNDAEVATIIAAARRHDHQFGLLVRVLAATGCRPGQIARCRKGDLLVKDALLIVPPSAKGRPTKPKPTSRMPLDPSLVRDLAAWAAAKAAHDLLFTLPRNVPVAGGIGWRVDGERGWGKLDWGRAAREAGIERRLYDLRHAAVVRMILADVPLRVIASKLDTSTGILERHYSRFIGDASDDLVRAALAYRRLAVVV